MNTKVRILIRCEACFGEAYMPAGEDVSHTGEQYTRYEPCTTCQGSGMQEKWVTLHEFANMLDRAVSMEPDYQELAHRVPVTQYQDSREAAGI